MSSVNKFNLNYKQVLIDEISLEGLEGLGFKQLWAYVAHRISHDVTEKMKRRFWNILLDTSTVEMYQLPEPAIYYEIQDRFKLVDEIGHLKDSDTFLDGPYVLNLIEGQFGSCQHYHTRKLLSKTKLKAMSYEDMFFQYGDTLVMVASLEERWHALAPQASFTDIDYLAPSYYAFLEIVGRGRTNGQMSTGKTHLLDLTKDAKLIFYYRSKLEELNLITVLNSLQYVQDRAIKGVLIRLPRFYTPKMLTVATVGPIYEVYKNLLSRPSLTAFKKNLLSNKVMDARVCKKLNKRIKLTPFKLLNYDDTSDPDKKNCKIPMIDLDTASEDSMGSEDENTEPPLKCKYRVGVNIYQQAYNLFKSSGQKGLTKQQLSQLLGVGFYTCRNICRIFTNKKLLKGFLEDKGKQRVSKYIAITSTVNTDETYATEKRKFLDLLATSKDNIKMEIMDITDDVTISTSDSQEPPAKKMKLNNELDSDNNELQNCIKEIKTLCQENPNKSFSESLLAPAREPSLKQLRLANVIITIVRELKVVEGLTKLNQLSVKDTKHLPMDSKSFKRLLSKLLVDEQIRIYDFKWPSRIDKHSIFVCAPHIKQNDPLLIAECRKLCANANSIKHKKKNVIETKLSYFIYSRYMKMENLHKYLFNLVYSKPKCEESVAHGLPEGFVTLLNAVYEMPLKLAISHINPNKVNIPLSKLDCDMTMKEAPPEILQTLLNSVRFSISLKNSFETLANFGLVQICFQVSAAKYLSDLQNNFIYINRQAAVIDTRGKWPRCDDLTKLEKQFIFNDIDDVCTYWTEVYDISTMTHIVLENRSKHIFNKPPIRNVRDVHLYDTGLRCGNGLGACGFHSSFYIEMPKFWQKIIIVPTKKVPLKKIVAKAVSKQVPIKKVNINTSCKKKKFTKKKVIPKDRKQTKPPLLLSRTETKRCKQAVWHDWDDDILLWVKVAISIMSPVTQPGSIQVLSSVSKDLICIMDPTRTISHCYHRSKYLDTNSSFVYRKEQLIAEIRRRQYILSEYEGSFRKIRMKYSNNVAKYIHEARSKCMELTWLVREISMNVSCQSNLPSALTLEEFYHIFHIRNLQEQKSSLYNVSTPDIPIQIQKLSETILLILNCHFHAQVNNDMSLTILDTLSKYPENDLRTAVQRIHKGGAVATRKNANNSDQRWSQDNSKLHFTGFKLSNSYQRRWLCRLNTSFVDNIYDLLESPPCDNLKGNAEISCFLNELNAAGSLKIVTTSCPKIADASLNESSLSFNDLEFKLNFKSGSIGWHNNSDVSTMKELYKDIDYAEAINSVIRNATIVKVEKEVIKIEGEILSALDQSSEHGKTFQELQNLTSMNTGSLKALLADYEENGIVKRVGYCQNHIVLTKYLNPWCASIDGINLIASPWFFLGTQIMYTPFIYWCGAILNKVFESPGCSIRALTEFFDYISPRSIQEICMFLRKCACVNIFVLKQEEPDLFSDDEPDTELYAFNEYEDIEWLIVEPVKDCIVRFSILKHEIKPFCKNF